MEKDKLFIDLGGPVNWEWHGVPGRLAQWHLDVGKQDCCGDAFWLSGEVWRCSVYDVSHRHFHRSRVAYRIYSSLNLRRSVQHTRCYLMYLEMYPYLCEMCISIRQLLKA